MEGGDNFVGGPEEKGILNYTGDFTTEIMHAINFVSGTQMYGLSLHGKSIHFRCREQQ